VTSLDERYGSAPTVLEEPAELSADQAQLPVAVLAASRRRELAGFLRSRRERISPEQVGLPSGGRRRTPGLRREEVALLSGLGVTWYTWLEQGRDIRVSPQVLEAVSRTLRLDRHERAHLFTLADLPLGVDSTECYAVTPVVRALLDKLDPFPAAVVNARYDVLAYNRGYLGTSGDLELLPLAERNSLWLAFASPARRALIVDWDEAVRRMVGLFRGAMADHVGEPAWRNLVQRLEQVSPEFRELWHRHDVEAPENLTKRLLHPQAGLLTFTYSNLWLTPGMALRLIVYTPSDARTLETLSRLEDLVPPSL
jgi:MmyB-like transcription regulator ligand binding domain/Helix-turn-helix domain